MKIDSLATDLRHVTRSCPLDETRELRERAARNSLLKLVDNRFQLK
ncbi:hypothetical protein AB0M87_06705 [Streptomyces sp. NPDC051320]